MTRTTSSSYSKLAAATAIILSSLFISFFTLPRYYDDDPFSPSSSSSSSSSSYYDFPARQLGDNNPPSTSPTTIMPYTLQNALTSRKLYRGDFLLLIYNPTTDKFIPYYSKKNHKKVNLAKTMWAYQYLVDRNMLKRTFPQRFNPKQNEFVIAIAGGDYPNLIYTPCIMKQSSESCIDMKSEHTRIGPILQFGSVFKAPVIPSMIGMPMPIAQHLRCFAQYSREQDQEDEGGGCKGFVFGNENEEWEDLIPQVVWRGTDFTYLTQLHVTKVGNKVIGAPLVQPNFEKDIEKYLLDSGNHNEMSTKETATQALRNMYDRLLPRWKGVVWTAQAELDAEQQQQKQLTDSNTDNTGTSTPTPPIPWANIKFSKPRHGKEGVDFSKFQSVGIPASGEYMTLPTLAHYKYHIDIGGGGGTTWTGTLQKLALPGLLFHHETPTKDYIADWIVPWTHYVPVREDLSDLKEKYDWAENNPEEARRIADNATQLIKALTTREGFEPFFNKFFREPLQRAIDAYQPVSSGDEGQSWQDILARKEYSDMVPVEKYGRASNPTYTSLRPEWREAGWDETMIK